MPGMTWTAEADAKLFLSILADASVKPNYEIVAKRLSVGDTVCTPRAVQERIKKLKKQAQDEGWSTAENGAADADGGPVKPKATRAPSKKKADVDADGESPTKKRRTAAAKATKSAAIVKEEESANDKEEETQEADETQEDAEFEGEEA